MTPNIKNPNKESIDNSPQDETTETEGLEVQQYNLKAHQAEVQQSGEGFEEVLKAARRTKKKKRNSRKTILTKEAKERAIKGRISETIAFLLVAGPLAAFLYGQHYNANASSMDIYLEARTFVIPAAWLIIAYEGWKTTNLSGILCAILPPYWIYYLIAEVDNRIMRGSVSALVIILALETVWTPDIAWLNGRQQEFNQFVGKVHTLITRPPDPYAN